MDMTNWTLQQKLSYWVGQLSMADEMLADLHRYSHAGVINAQISKVETRRADVIKQIEALAGLNDPEIYVCHRSKLHRALYPIRSSELRIDQLLEYPVKTHVYFDGTDVVLLSRFPLCFSDIRFLIWDIREMRHIPKRFSYVQVMYAFMARYFGYAVQWSLRESVDALRATYEHIIRVEAEWYEFVRGGDHA